jgi:predicted small lipoprotein YifL
MVIVERMFSLRRLCGRALVGALVATLHISALTACGGPREPQLPDEANAAPKKASADEGSTKKRQALPPGTIARQDVDEVLKKGPGWLLNKVQTEEVLRQNKFVGWRVVAFPAEWDGSGLQPGDVVIDVNGVALERPDDLWTAWLNVAGAPELRISFERDGKPAQTVVKIQGEPSGETKQALESGDMPPPPQAEAKKTYRRDTKIITSESSDPGTSVEY